MKTYLSLAIILSFMFLFATFSFAKEYPKGVIISRESDGYKIDFTLPEYSMKDIYANNSNFINLDISDYGEHMRIGYPKLPQITFSLMVAYGEQSPSVSILNQIQELKILGNKILPVQKPLSKNPNGKTPSFDMDTSYYKSSGNINGPFAMVSEPFIIRGVKGIMITICPFAYNPSSNQLKITTRGSFKIRLEKEPVLRNSPSSDFNKFYNAVFLNYVPVVSTGTSRYLIITAPDFEASLSQFISEKQNLNYIVTVANTNVTGTTNTSIKNYIQNLYNNINTRPEFVLFVGDVDKIPEWVGTGIGIPHTDLNYSLLEGNDSYADIFLGRFPVQNTVQLANMINKTLYMENAINILPKKTVLCSSNDFWPIAEGTNDFCIDSFFIPSVYSNIKLYCHTYNATTQQLTNALNANQLFALYTGHGSETAWGDGPPFNQSNVNALNNTVFPYVYSFSCLTGSYHISNECFGETWVRGPKGAVVFWGASVYSYLYPDDILQKRIFRAMFTEHLTKTSPSYVLGKYLLTQYYGGVGGPSGNYMQGYLEMYNCLGDPSVFMDGYGPIIVHNPLQDTENLTGPYTINCTITPRENPINISNAKVFWMRGENFTDSILLTNSSGNNFTANIPGNGNPAIYKYYLKSLDNLNFPSYMPPGAPDNFYTFTACADTIKPIIYHVPLTNKTISQWPSYISAKVTDNIGLDSVWIKWHINTPVNGIRFVKLNYTSNNIYSTIFNSTQNDININDTIYYRIYAKDNSLSHNTDSTVMYSFAITNQSIINIGSATTASNYPFSTSYRNCRTQMLFLASEISPASSPASASEISGIGFNVAQNSYQVMNGFNIKMQNTNVSTVTGWTNSGWTTYYSGTFTVSGTGWKYINLMSPFHWDGASNLLVEICFENNTYTSDTYVYATEMLNRGWANRSDTYAGCSLTGGLAELKRPDVSLIITQPVNVQNISGEIPDKYFLYQNYPNPFNPFTRIKFELPKNGFVTLKIFDVLGREVRTLINEEKAPGKYSIDFNGEALSSGVYFYKIQSGDFIQVRKMVILR